jgi:hypothetical protein
VAVSRSTSDHVIRRTSLLLTAARTRLTSLQKDIAVEIALLKAVQKHAG